MRFSSVLGLGLKYNPKVVIREIMGHFFLALSSEVHQVIINFLSLYL